MNPKAVIGIVLIALGAIALYFGLQAADSPLERARETLTGNYSDETMLHLVGGGVAIVVGVALVALRGRR